MHPKTLTALESLDNWTSKIIHEGKSSDWHLLNFIETQDIKSYQRYYQEMIVHVHSLKAHIPDIDKLVDDYTLNETALIENSKDNSFFETLFNIRDEHHSRRERIDTLMFTLNDIKNNVSNIIYQVKINQG